MDEGRTGGEEGGKEKGRERKEEGKGREGQAPQKYFGLEPPLTLI